MTRHALAQHAPEGAIFAVSSFGPGAIGNRPPAELRPLGLEGPLGWVAEQLEARDRARDGSALGAGPARPAPARALRPGLRAALPPIKPIVRVPRAARQSCGGGGDGAGSLAGRPPAARSGRGSGRIGSAGFPSRHARSREPATRPRPAVARRWAELLERHPSLPLFWPALARRGPAKRAEWQVKAADVQVANGTAPADLDIAARPAQGPGARSSPPRSARSRPPRNRCGMTSAGRPSTPKPSRSPLSTTPLLRSHDRRIPA